jgi:nitrile hydratase
MSVASNLGGRTGFGPVVPEINEPVFHADWERRVFGLVLAMGATGTWSLDASRFAREDRPLSEYLHLSYYELWLAALQRLLLEHDLLTAQELASGQPERPATPVHRRLDAGQVEGALRRGSPSSRQPSSPPRFAIDDQVRTRTLHTNTHTRLPTFARSKRGRVTAVHGCHVYPDANAHGHGEHPQCLYTVTFTAAELYQSPPDPRVTVSVDAFEPYLEPA